MTELIDQAKELRASSGLRRLIDDTRHRKVGKSC